MATSSAHNEHLPQQAMLALEYLGDALSIARLRRKQSLRAWAAQTSCPTWQTQPLTKGRLSLTLPRPANGWLRGVLGRVNERTI